MVGQPFPWVTLCELNPAHSFPGRQRPGDYTKQVEAPLTPSHLPGTEPPASLGRDRVRQSGQGAGLKRAGIPGHLGSAGRCPCGSGRPRAAPSRAERSHKERNGICAPRPAVPRQALPLPAPSRKIGTSQLSRPRPRRAGASDRGTPLFPSPVLRHSLAPLPCSETLCPKAQGSEPRAETREESTRTPEARARLPAVPAGDAAGHPRGISHPRCR